MKFAVKVATSKKNNNKYFAICAVNPAGCLKMIAFLKPFDVSYLLNLTARETHELEEGVYTIE